MGFGTAMYAQTHFHGGNIHGIWLNQLEHHANCQMERSVLSRVY